VKLNLGSGVHPTPPGWTSVDADEQHTPDVIADVLSLPFPFRSADALYAGHLCEHIDLRVLPTALREWRRVLKPGGELMLVGPDIDRAVEQGVGKFLLDAIIKHGTGWGGHAWTCSETVLAFLVENEGWTVESVPITTVRSPEYPNVAPDALWQYALRCT
jgi:SAM-dependent methyltransferase